MPAPPPSTAPCRTRPPRSSRRSRPAADPTVVGTTILRPSYPPSGPVVQRSTVTATASPARTGSTSPSPPSRRGDRAFAGIVRTAALTILLALVAVFVFLAIEGWVGLTADAATYAPFASFGSYIVPLIVSTLLASAIALVVAVPFAIAVALFISHYAPRRLASVLGYVVDLLAAVPSVVFGLWGGRYLAAYLQPFHVWLHEHLGFLPFFGPGPPSANGRSLFTAGIVLAIMILPIVTAISREVFLQTP